MINSLISTLSCLVGATNILKFAVTPLHAPSCRPCVSVCIDINNIYAEWLMLAVPQVQAIVRVAPVRPHSSVSWGCVLNQPSGIFQWIIVCVSGVHVRAHMLISVEPCGWKPLVRFAWSGKQRVSGGTCTTWRRSVMLFTSAAAIEYFGNQVFYRTF